MKAFQREKYLSSIEPESLLRESLIAPQVIENLSTVQKVHYKIESAVRLKCIMKLYHEWANDLL